MESTAKKTARRQLDRRYERLGDLPLQPTLGWVRAVRQALGMSMRQMATRMGKSSSAVVAIERGELTGGLSLKRLREAADALECDVVHLLVPRRGGIEATLRSRAREVANSIVETTHAHMVLEGQELGSEANERQVDELTELLLQEPQSLWKKLPGK